MGATGGVRIDHGIAAGGEVTPYYDAMVAKFIAHGRDRADAIRRLTPRWKMRHCSACATTGVSCATSSSTRVRRGALTTTRLDEWAAGGEPLLQRPAPPDVAWRIAAAWLGGGTVDGVRPASVGALELTLECDGEERTSAFRWRA